VMGPAPLEYATPSPRRSYAAWWAVLRRVVRYALVLLPIGMIVAAAVVSYRAPWVWYGSRDAYQRHRMLTFMMPADRVVYEEDPARAARLAALPPDRRAAYVGEPPNPGGLGLAGGGKGDYRKWPGNSHTSYIPPFFFSLFGTHGPPTLVFIHQRVGPGGRRRMVQATLGRDLVHQPPGRPLENNVRVGISVATRSDPVDQPFRARGGNYRVIRIPVAPEAVMRVYAGQPDPGDEARFTVKYEIDGVPGTIEGRLEADDAVTLRVVDGPAATGP
jgi:hypothetical protein